jgi:hypothetical protein
MGMEEKQHDELDGRGCNTKVRSDFAFAHGVLGVCKQTTLCGCH